MLNGFHLTPKRIEALRLLRSRTAGVYVRMLAQEVLVGEYRRRINSGFSAQQATRSGAGYAVPLIKAGLVKKEATTYGWGIVSITAAGIKALDDLDAQQLPLEAVLDRCFEAGKEEPPPP